MPASLPSGVRLRGSTYQLRIGVPDDIRHLWPRRADGSLAIDAYRASLKTSNRNEAAARAHAIIADYHRQFEDIRARNAPAPFVTITAPLADQFAAEARRLVLQAEESNTFYTTPVEKRPAGYVRYFIPDTKQEIRDDFASAGLEAVSAMREGSTDLAQRYGEIVAHAWGLRVDWAAPDGRSCLIRITRALVGAWKDVERREQGDPIETPEPAAPPVPSQAVTKPPKLSDVIPSWINRNSPKQDAIGRTRRAVALFEQVTQGIPVPELRKAHGAAFVAWLLDPSREFGRKTAGNIAAAVTAVVNVAVKDDLIDRNPLDLSFDKTIGSERREPWTDEELKLMLGSPLFSDQMATVPRWANVDPEDGRALLSILMHTGARLGEVGQLRCEDFVTRSGLLCIRFTAEAGTLKTAESERTVPLPSHLLDDPWFAGWLQGVQGRTGQALPSLNGRVKGVSDVGARWFAQYREATGLPAGKLKGSHRFRHWLRTALAEVGVNTETADAITGHAATGSSGRRVYTATASLPTMKAALDAVKWP
ncbi:tyrosine-type recombinase/integrase [Paraburkholderia sp. EG286B]|uniref:DUF6538 domain-containing protein n=1 Tax=Paraburkholderia sp. EG286B TaxID=3237011 RepID=UPI0034D28344